MAGVDTDHRQAKPLNAPLVSSQVKELQEKSRIASAGERARD